MNAPPGPVKTESDRDTSWARALLFLLAGSYVVFLFFYVPRLNNYVLSDREFTGWVGPIAERVARGERPYIDFVLPIPPGSFLLLAWIQKIAGRALLLQELWVAALSHLTMGLIGYAIARQFSTRRVSLLVTFSTLVLVTQTPKECVYDHTSLIFAWLSMLSGSAAAMAPDGERRRRLWFVTGLLSTFTLAFKQSTAVGVVAGWLLALAYLAIAEWRDRSRESLRERVREAAGWAAGAAVGLVLCVGVLLWARASITGFVQAVLIDGPSLKGGTRALLLNLFNFTTRHDAIRNAIVPTAAVGAIGYAVARRRGTLHVGDERDTRAPITPFAGIAFAVVVLGVYGGATALLAFEVRQLNLTFTAIVETLKNVPPYGYVFGIVFFVSHLTIRTPMPESHRRAGHALNALLLSSVTCSMIYDTSFVQYSAFYYNDPSIPIVLLCLYVATERSGLSWATPVALILSVLPTFGTKLDRALTADVRVRSGQWAGLRVNYRGVEVLRAALRAQELAGATGTVLVLPEDLEIAGVVQRPRPPVLGAILFVDQYPKRLLAHDLDAIDRHPPDVILIHPRRLEDWQGLYHTWTIDSAAERMLGHVLGKMIPKDYVLDSTYPTIYFFDQGQLDVYVRKHRGGS